MFLRHCSAPLLIVLLVVPSLVAAPKTAKKPATPSKSSGKNAEATAKLLEAAAAGDEDRILSAIAAGADVNARDDGQATPLILTAPNSLFMKDRIGDLYTGVATGFVGSGVFVTIDEPFVEVLVRSEALGPDAYELDEQGLAMVGVRSGDRIDIGDSVSVIIEDVAILRRTVYGRRVGGAEDREGKPVVPGRRATKKSGRTANHPALPSGSPKGKSVATPSGKGHKKPGGRRPKRGR